MSVTAYKMLKAPINQIDRLVGDAITDGWQPFGSPIMLFPQSMEVYQAVVKGMPATGFDTAIEADATSGLVAADNIQDLAIALSARIKALEDLT